MGGDRTVFSVQVLLIFPHNFVLLRFPPPVNISSGMTNKNNHCFLLAAIQLLRSLPTSHVKLLRFADPASVTPPEGKSSQRITAVQCKKSWWVRLFLLHKVAACVVRRFSLPTLGRGGLVSDIARKTVGRPRRYPRDLPPSISQTLPHNYQQHEIRRSRNSGTTNEPDNVWNLGVDHATSDRLSITTAWPLPPDYEEQLSPLRQA